MATVMRILQLSRMDKLTLSGVPFDINRRTDFKWIKVTLSGVPFDINRRTDINWCTELITYLKSACTHAIQPYQLTLSGVPTNVNRRTVMKPCTKYKYLLLTTLTGVRYSNIKLRVVR